MRRLSIKCCIITCLCLAFTTLCAQNKGIISGDLTGFSLPAATTLSISRFNGFDFFTEETIAADASGHFKFSKEFNEGIYRLAIPADNFNTLLFMYGKNNVEVAIHKNLLSGIKTTYKDTENIAFSEMAEASQHLEITLNTLLEEFNPRHLDSFYLKKIIPYNLKVQDAYRNFNSRLDALKKQYPESIAVSTFSNFYRLPLFDEDKQHSSFYDNQDAYMRDHFFDLWKLDDPKVIYLPEIKSKTEKYFRYFAMKDEAFLIKTCDSIISHAGNFEVQQYLSALLVDFFTRVKEEGVVAFIVDHKLKGCFDGIDLSQINYNMDNLNGSKISTLNLPAQDKTTLDLSAVYSAAKLTVLYFWTPDCMHCRELHPIVKNIKNKYTHDIAVYTVCMEDDEKKWTSTLNEFSLNSHNTIASGETRKKVSRLFNIRYTPLIYLVNSSGIILEKDVDRDGLDVLIKKHLE